MSDKTDIASANMLELEDEELEKEELEMMSGLCGFACLIPMQEMQLLEAYFFHRLKDSLVSSFLHPQNGKFVAKKKKASLPSATPTIKPSKRRTFISTIRKSSRQGLSSTEKITI